MKHCRTSTLVACATAAIVWAAACGDSGTAPAAPDPPRPTTVAVTPAAAELTALGETARFTAEVRDQNGQLMAGATVAWTSSDASVAAVDASGVVTAAANGAATITATAGAVSGTAAVTVAQVVSAVTVSPASDTLVTFGDTVRLAAQATDANGHAVAEATEFAWASSDTLVARVDDTGLVETVAEGEAVITATTAGVTGQADLIVVPPLPTTVAVSPDTVRFTALGQTEQLAAEVREQSGRLMGEAMVSWASRDTLVVAVDSTGLATALGGGMTTVTARAGDASGDVVVSVMQSVGSVVVSPVEGTVALGDTLRLAAEAFDENGHAVAGAVFSWSSSDAEVARVDQTGLVAGVAEGTATIMATAGSASGTAEIMVESPDRAALVALYSATNGPNWVNNENWLTAAPLREWYGVETGAYGRVVRLDLSGRWDSEVREWIPQGLSGPIPLELGDLGRLRILDLGHNSLSGRIPPEFRDLVNLERLDLASNGIAGAIPVELARLGKLRSLSLYRNALEGRIPAELGNLVNLEWLDLGRNKLAGPIPVELANLVKLRGLGLNGNALEGRIPAELGNLVNLEWLGLWGNELGGPIPPELANLAELRNLSLGRNALEGRIPAEFGNLVNLEWLGLDWNKLEGSIPQEFLQLDKLRGFFIRRNEGLCVPGISAFVTWLEGIEHRDESGALCNESDREVLESFFERAGGSGWTNADGWVSGPALDEWHGIRADPLGRVTALDLEQNKLSGRLPATLGALTQMTELRIGGNANLSGPLPLSLMALPLGALHYEGTGVCAPSEAGFREWLNTISSHEGTGVACTPLSDRQILEAVYEALRGPDWTNRGNWLTARPLRDWHGVEVDGQGRVTGLSLTYNRISGWIPPELGSLTNLRYLRLGGFSDISGVIPPQLGNLGNLRGLSLFDTELEGGIPPELGNLSDLNWLSLTNNRLEGRIPPELGGLASLRQLTLDANELDGPIPAEIGDLTDLGWLSLADNELAGVIPPELGGLTSLRRLSVDRNRLTGQLPGALGALSNLEGFYAGHNNLEGPVPEAFRSLASLRELGLSGNTAMSGPLPSGLTALNSLETLVADATGLCAPAEPGFLEWLDRLPTRRVAVCGTGPATAYLVQAVQSRDFPVPLVAGDAALLRTFVTALHENREPLPPVRASFHRDGSLVHVAEIPAGSARIPTEVDEGALSASPSAVIPAEVIRPGLEMVIEIDPDGTLDPGLDLARRIPETGRLAVDVREMPVLDLTVIPFLWAAEPDLAILELTAGMAANPHEHALLADTRTLLPVGGLDVTRHEPVTTTSNSMFTLHSETSAIRALEGGSGHWMGMMSGSITGAGGVGSLPGRVSSSAPYGGTIAHELGHNMNLRHAPCGGAGGPDPAFPYNDGSAGVWGYDFHARRLVRPDTPDLMSYCGPSWVSDYHFSKALQFRIDDEGGGAATMAPGAVPSLLLWGGADEEGVPYLEPAFVVDAPVALPEVGGEYRLLGQAAGGGELFSLSFAMPVVADSDGSSSFAFVLPVQPGWEDGLVSITLTGPGGSFTLDQATDLPMTILRDPITGQVGAILREPETAAMSAFGATEAQRLDVLFSRGIPDTEAWRQ